MRIAGMKLMRLGGGFAAQASLELTYFFELGAQVRVVVELFLDPHHAFRRQLAVGVGRQQVADVLFGK
jgi:hypothetical protein